MFKTPVDYVYDQGADSLGSQFKIQSNDQITFRLFANNGFRMIDLVDNEVGNVRNNMNRIVFNYLVDNDGRTKLPLLGMVQVAGLTIREAELMLEERYVKYYNEPFVQLTVSNRRAVIYPGGGGDAKVVALENNNTTLLEALAEAGGMAKRGDARHVKLFRRDTDGTRKVYSYDMSDISGLSYADVVLQADDIIYVQPVPELAREVLNDITPLITLLTTTVLVIGIVRGFQ
ncbi:MAG TPA: polysaccharide biosynthesis/export family protein [Flavobacteriales bacterium]